jgi:peroxiredoxin
MAPDFTLPALGGGDVSLAAHRGKVVVLEWFNPQCPFVVQSHTDGTLKGMRAKHADVVWLAINSGSPGKQGHGVAINTEAKARFGMDYPLLFDEDGKVGRAYGAERTPHMYVINPEGRIVYQGAIDNSGGGDIEDTPKLENHVADALADLGAKRAPRLMRSKSWGCTVKYPD